MIPIGFDRPVALLLLALLPIIWWLAWRRRHAIGRVRVWVSTSARSLLILLLAASLSQPSIVRKGEGVTLLVVADVSQSVPTDQLQSIERELHKATRKPPNSSDRLGVVTVARNAEVAELPTVLGEVHFAGHASQSDGTDLAAGVRRALALLPSDTMNRLLLISDGNETVGSLRGAAEVAKANGIPIDVLPIEYNQKGVTVFEGIKAPTRARVGQSVDLKCFIRSQGGASGTLYIKENGVAVDLDPDAPGDGRAIQLSAGPNAVEVPMSLDRSGAQRYEAVFEPDSASADGIVQNKRGAATVFVSGEGRVLVVDTSDESKSLVEALTSSGITVEVVQPTALDQGIAYLASFDAIVLCNIARFEIDNTVDRMLHAYVHDLGGGLLVVGGDKSYGAGGWIDSELAKALPVKLDPPATRELPRGALALVMHSCEIPQGNYWSEVVAISAIEALSRLDYVGIVVFGFGGQGGVGGAGWFFPMQLAGDKSAAISAAKAMSVGDMPDFHASMQVAIAGLKSLKVGQRHAIVISDGDPSPPSKQLLDEFKANKITITTVMVAGHGTAQDLHNMKMMAELTGGNFYNVTNPKLLPKIFVKEASLVSRNLMVEGEFQPTVVAGVGGPVDGIGGVPPVRGYVLTVPREGLGQIAILNRTTEGNDPIYAYWNYGIGKSVAFTSDLSGRWGGAWAGWAGFQSMWERTVRWMMRPATPSDVIIKTNLDGETATVELEASTEGGFVNFMRTDARVISPDGSLTPLALEQVGPGRYRGKFALQETGSYLVDVGLLDANGSRTGGSIQGSVSLAYPREFRTTRDNAALLRSVAQETGGRVLAMRDLATIDLFDRSLLERPESVRRIWDILAIIAAALIVIDVATRRLVVDGQAARELAQQALGSGASAAQGATVAAWKKARSRAATQSDEQPADSAAMESAERRPAHSKDAIKPRASGKPATDPNTTHAGADENAQRNSELPNESPMERLRRAKKRAQSEHSDEEGDAT